MTYRLESLVNPDGIVMVQLKGEDHVVGFASFRLDVVKEFMGSMLILKDKLNDAGLIDVPDADLVPIPPVGSQWN